MRKHNILTLILITFSFNACSILNFAQPGPKKVTIVGKSFNLEWKYDLNDQRYNVEDLTFIIYYQNWGNSGWEYLNTIPYSSHPNLVINSEILPQGKYVFAVSIIANQFESLKHSSIEATASPLTGWYVEWIPTE